MKFTKDKIKSIIKAEITKLTGIEYCDVKSDELLSRYGLDSLDVIDVQFAVEKLLGIDPMKSIESFDHHKTISEMADAYHKYLEENEESN